MQAYTCVLCVANDLHPTFVTTYDISHCVVDSQCKKRKKDGVLPKQFDLVNQLGDSFLDLNQLGGLVQICLVGCQHLDTLCVAVLC